MQEEKKLTGYPSIDKPWLKYYTEEAINAPLPCKTVYELIWDKNKDHLDEPALVYKDKKYTFGQMFKNIERTARAFAALGVKNGDVVTLMMLHTPESVFCFYALSKLGATANYINVLSTREEVAHYLDECNGHYLVTLDVFADKIPVRDDLKVVAVSMVESLGVVTKLAYRMKIKKPAKPMISWKEFISAQADYTQAVYENNHIAVIGHTGGTTGSPKGLLLRDQALNGQAEEYINSFDAERGQRFLCAVIPFVMYGLCTNMHMPLSLGLETILIPKVDVESVDELFIKYRPNHIISVPSVWGALSTSKKMQNEDLSYLVTVAAGGDGMSIELEKTVNSFFANHNSTAIMKKGYGMSEVCAAACTHTNTAPSKGKDAGVPFARVTIAAFDPDTQEEMKYGERGEICILSPYVMERYMNNPEETAQLMRVHKDGKTWVHTGDLGYVDEDGYVFITGRIKRIFIVRHDGIAVKVFPDQTEKAIRKCDFVHECCVVPKEDKEKVNRVAAYIVLNEGIDQEQAKQEVMRACRENLPVQFVPDTVEMLDALPLTAVGKVDYKKLENMGQE